MFSVVIPLYNKEKYISRAIKSVIEQTYKIFELIIIDDGSIDNSVNIVKKHKDSRIRLIEQENSGVSATRNKGIKNAKYNYIAFLDADDEWKPNFLDTIVRRIESLSNVEALDERLYTEVAILSDKLDVNEEKIRLKEHIKKFTSMMNEKGQIGKRLDFIAQEMLREINTISSKSNSSKVAHIIVEMKNHIDRIREHCRNVV